MKGYWPNHSPIKYNLNIPYSVKEIAERSFWGFGIYDQKNELTGETNRYYNNYGAIVKVRMGKNVRKIGYRAFFNCGFTKLMLPESLEEIGKEAFARRENYLKGEDYINLQTVYIPPNVKTIAEDAFDGNTGMTIWGFKGTLAETYAKEHGFNFESAYDYTELPDGTVSLDKCNINTYKFEKLIDIPLNVNGKTVSELGKNLYVAKDFREPGVATVGGVQYDPPIVIPDTVKKIGSRALPWTYQELVVNLKNDAEASSTAFSECHSVTLNLTGEGSINDNAFDECKNVKHLNIGEGIKSIGKEAFMLDEDIETVSLPDSLETIGDEAFYNCYKLGADSAVIIPKNVTSIGEEAFCGCTDLKSVILPEGLKEIGTLAFSYCTSLREIVIPESVTKLGVHVFDNMGSDFTMYVKPGSTAEAYAKKNNIRYISGIFRYEIYGGDDYITLTGLVYEPTEPTDLEIPTEYLYRTVSNVIGFTNIDALKSVRIPASVLNIGIAAFTGCKNLDSFEIDPGTTKYCSVDGFLYNKDKTELLRCLPGKMGEEYTVPDGVEKISGFAFDGCENLKKINIPKSVTEIDKYVFDYCPSLAEINVAEDNESFCSVDGVLYTKDGKSLVKYPRAKSGAVFSVPISVDTIMGSAFSRCGELKVLTVPEKVTTFGDWAVSGVPEDFVMSVEKDSEAENYAKNNKIKYVYSEIQSGKVGDCEWVFDNTSGVFTAKGPGKFDWDDSVNDILTKTKHFVALDGVTAIGDYVLLNGEELESVSLAGSVKELGEDCFSNCPKLTNIELNEGLEVIGSGTIAELPLLSELKLPGTLKVLKGCSSLDSIKKIDIPEGVTEISGGLCVLGSVEEISLPGSLKTIGEFSFSDVPKMKKITVPAAVETIGEKSLGYAGGKYMGKEFTIIGEAGSAAQKYAGEHGLNFEVFVKPTEPTQTEPTKPTETETTLPVETTTEAAETTETTIPTDNPTEATETTETTVPNDTTEPVETTTSEVKPTTPAGVRVVNYLPSKEQFEKGNIVKLVIQNRDKQFAIYNMTASPMIIDGAPVFTAEIPENTDPITVQVQIYKGETWVDQITLTPEQFNSAQSKIITSDGSVYGEIARPSRPRPSLQPSKPKRKQTP
ncbi:MAG: leucine-rich repeat domain-containing protein [Ruminococcus sp.]|nr:leucine-rich repeat domain-containing protein [Ruminococcus sp.]